MQYYTAHFGLPLFVLAKSTLNFLVRVEYGKSLLSHSFLNNLFFGVLQCSFLSCVTRLLYTEFILKRCHCYFKTVIIYHFNCEPCYVLDRHVPIVISEVA